MYKMRKEKEEGLGMKMKGEKKRMEQQSEYRVDMREAFKIYLDEREGMLKASDGDSAGDCPSVGKQSPESVPFCFGTYEVGICKNQSSPCGKSEKCRYATEHPMVETKDDLSELAEPEPPWKAMEYQEGWSQIERKWTNIEIELVLIRVLYKERADEEFKERLAKMMEVS